MHIKRDREGLKKNQFELLEMKKIILNGIKSILNTEEEKINNPEDIAIDIIKNKTQRKK